MNYDVAIIGGGPAGLTAAIYTCRAGRKTVLLEMGAPGGQAATTDVIENYPGFPEGIDGPDLMIKFYQQAQRFGCEFVTAQATGLKHEGIKKTVSTTGDAIEAKAVVVATGTRSRELGVRGEKELRGKGVSYCANCDGFFFKNKKVAVVGGGDAAVKEAIYLARIVREVVILHRRDEFRAAKVLGDRAINTPNIKIVWDTVVDEMVGENRLQGLRVHNVKTQASADLEVDGVFLYVGTQPNTDFLDAAVRRTPQGYLITNEKFETSVKGVFAAGDCREKGTRQVATAVGDGAGVLEGINEYLDSL